MDLSPDLVKDAEEEKHQEPIDTKQAPLNLEKEPEIDGQTNEYILEQIVAGTSDDRMFGSVVGAFIGDSCGSFNEFNRNISNEKFMKECMEMNGGGPFGLSAGQITDDSELAMMMMHGLLDKHMP